MKDLQITVDFRRARSRGETTDGIDISALIETVPSARILAGDPNVSVQVRIREHDQERLRAAVREFCVVEDHSDIHLY